MRRRWRVIAGCGLASPALLLLAGVLLPDSAFMISMALHAVSVLVTGFAMHQAGRHGDPRLRRARTWFARALAASAAGFVVSGVHTAILGHVPILGPAALAPLVWVPCALIGLLAIPSEQHREGGRWRAVLDALIVAGSLASLSWMLFLGPIYYLSERTGLAKAVSLGYPVIDLVLAVAAFGVATHARGDLRRFLHLMTAGLLLVALADAGSAANMAAGERGFGWTNVVLQAGLATLLCGALLRPGTALGDERRSVTALVDAALPHLPLVAGVLVAVQQTVTGNPLDPIVVVLAALTVLGLVVRQVLYASHLGAVAHRLAVEAARDGLTGLANRRAFLASLETALAERPVGEVAVVLLDLDGFKEVNDTFGHGAGDVALSDFADLLVVTLGDSAGIARLGGDEFAVLVVGDNAEHRAWRSALSLVNGQSSAIGAVTLSVGASAGVAVGRAGDTSSALLRRADLAMYSAKRSGQARASLFTDDLADRADRRHLLTQALPGAARRGELELVYQPLFRLADGSVAGAEALLRWSSPLHGQISPVEFVPLAEETGVITEIGCWVLSQATAQMKEWAAAGQLVPNLSVNVSPRQLVDGFADEVLRRVAEHGVAPSAITLEITESAMPDLPANRCLDQLRAAGFSIAMDDFGAGFSSLAQLALLPVDSLKFDREFIRGIATPDGRRIVDAMFALAADLGLATVAEGIETAAEADVVRQAGCVYAQGYHFSRPVTAAEIGRLVARRVPTQRADTDGSLSR